MTPGGATLLELDCPVTFTVWELTAETFPTGAFRVADLARVVDLKWDTAEKHLDRLVEFGAAEKILGGYRLTQPFPGRFDD